VETASELEDGATGELAGAEKLAAADDAVTYITSKSASTLRTEPNAETSNHNSKSVGIAYRRVLSCLGGT
jgi:hypothetical protein